MQITKLKIFGFKSFAQRTEINFPTKGLTAVVGPNGCGKSNITDAIRWVLGEQRAATLRMSKMQDVIFSGTEERAAMSLAEVSIVIDNSDGALSSEYSEIIVTRRVHRDGTGEYLINNQECRLRDVHALLFDSGLGSSTYSQMNADMIKAVLSDKADDRRVLFEEAAGVSKYRQQRKEATRQLERVQMDMARVEDNLRSVRRSVRLYETQAEKVKEFKWLSNRLKSLDLSVSLDKYEDFKESLTTLDTTSRRMNHEVESAKTKAMELQTRIEEKKLAISEDENNYRELEQQVQQATLALNDLNNQIIRLRDSVSSLEAANQKAASEIEISEGKTRELQEERARLEEENEILKSDSGIEELNSRLKREKEILQVMRDKLDDLRGQSRELSNERLTAANRVASLQGRFQRLDAESDMLRGSVSRWNDEVGELRNRKSETESAIRDMEAGMEATARELEILNERKASLESTLDGKNADLATAQQELQALQNECAALESRIEVLQSVNDEGTDAGKWIRENKAGLVRGFLSEHISAAPEYASQVEAALGDCLDSAVVESRDGLREIVEGLRSENAGKAVLALMDSLELAPVPELNHPGIRGALSSFVTCDDTTRIFVQNLLSRYFLVDSLDTALDLAREHRNSDFCFVADKVVVKTNGLVSQGANTAGALSRKNEIAQATERLAAVQGQVAQKQAALESLQAEIEETRQMLASASDEILEKNNALRAGEAGISIQKNTLESVASRLEKLEVDIAESEGRIATAESQKLSDADLNEAKAAMESAEAEYARVNDELVEQETLFREKDEEVRDLERTSQDKSAKLSQNTDRLRNIADQVQFLGDSIESRKRDMETNKISMEKAARDIDDLGASVQEKDFALRELEGRRDAARERYEVVSGDLDSWRSELDTIRDDMIDKMKELNEVGRKQEALQSNLDRLQERLQNEWSFDLQAPEEFERVEYSQPEADKEIRELRGKIKELGPINVNVMEDYEDEKKRLEEVEIQFNDLDRARASLDRTITKLDDIARSRYLETFERIQKNFQFVFSKLFLNGETKMSLVEKLDENGKPGDILDADIEINVRPTGKKMRGIKALSGGEHALTATALLFAIYMEKPSPYCVLDEVDGPLDDANVGRFMALLREFSKQTLFIVVTHNKRTMAEADMLYGVTQEIKGISRIASVQLADATKFAI
ncbi:MAG: chromosome segregation protein SMC [Fibrobacter sp.]|nr:chromosome segregation protein SMC [Fibrobacter sp.]